MKYISSYQTGRYLENGKPEIRIGYFETGKGCIVSFPARLSGYKEVALRDVAAILRGDSVINSDGYREEFRPAWRKGIGQYIRVSVRDCVPVAQIKIAATPMVLESTYTRRDLGAHESTMQLSALLHTPGLFHIEWDIPGLETTEEICIHTEGYKGARRMIDYDGVMCLPREAVGLLRQNGIIVPRDFL